MALRRGPATERARCSVRWKLAHRCDEPLLGGVGGGEIERFHRLRVIGSERLSECDGDSLNLDKGRIQRHLHVPMALRG